MEMIIGCIFLGVIIVLFLILSKNIQITIKLEYPENDLIKVPDLYKEDGDPKEENKEPTIDDVLSVVNEIMLDSEE